MEWFKLNSMAANPIKFKIIFLGTENNNIIINIDGNKIRSSTTVKLQGITIDNKLTFYPHIQEMCKKTSRKIKALLRFRNNICQTQSDILFQTFIMSSLNYCLLVWMFSCNCLYIVYIFTY